MTKQEFVSEVAERSGLTNKDAGRAVDAFLETVTDTLTRRGDVVFTGFGKFSTSDRAARMGVNPRNPTREGAHRGGDRAEVLGRQPAQGRGQGRRELSRR